MELTLETLQELGAFTGAPALREITWQQGEKSITATVYVRTMSYHSAKSDLQAMAGKVDPVAGRIAACICDPTGKPLFTAADITGEADPNRGAMDGNLVMALLRVVHEVSGLGKPESLTSSPKKTSSGTNSSLTESAAEQ